MKQAAIEGVLLTPLKQIPNEKGDLMHAMKKSDAGFSGFGEAYFSTVHQGVIKAWKKHRKMVLNLTVPVGCIRFVIKDLRQDSKTFGSTMVVALGPNNYQRLTVPNNLWFGFEGVGEGLNLLLNIADMEHDPTEMERAALEQFDYPAI